jgi:hypothetical protein
VTFSSMSMVWTMILTCVFFFFFFGFCPYCRVGYNQSEQEEIEKACRVRRSCSGELE